MADVGTLIMKIEADTQKFTQGISRVTGAIGKVGKTVAVGTAAVTGALLLCLWQESRPLMI